MVPEDDTTLRISKWPFYLGDALLVLTALSIGLLGGWDLSSGEIFACVLSVALGGGLFVLPYLYEYTMRIREEVEDREASFRVIERQIKHVESRLFEMQRQLSLRSGEADLKEYLEPLEKRLQNLQAKVKETRADADELSSLTTRLDSMDQRIEALEALPEVVTPKVEALQPASQKKRPKKNNLLKRAMNEKQESDLQAVSRIIEAVPEEVKSSSSESKEVSLPDEVVAKTEAKVTDVTADEARKPAIVDSDFSRSKESRLSVMDEKPVVETPLQVEPIRKRDESESASSTDPVENPIAENSSNSEVIDSEPELADQPVGSTDLFGESVPLSAPKKRKRKGKNDSVLTVHALIGIGNKPYLRGSGGGLNWERGIQMNFQSIGKWEWTAPDGFDQAIELQVYCNDSEPDQNGKYLLEPGEKLEISPEF
ncbi:MAG: hypothetical protein ACON46_01525 [Coraliomargaritaceae bacterium]